MPKHGRKQGPKFISNFLIPSLEERKFGNRLKWVDREKAKFELVWNHKSASYWSEFDAEVFIEWDKQKGRYKPEDKEYYSKSKQRFRALLYKLIRQKQIVELKSDNRCKKIFCIEENIMNSEESFCKVDEQNGVTVCGDPAKNSTSLNGIEAMQNENADYILDDDTQSNYELVATQNSYELVAKQVELSCNENFSSELLLNESSLDHTTVIEPVEVLWNGNALTKLPVIHSSCKPLIAFLKGSRETSCRMLNEVEEKSDSVIIPKVLVKQNEPLLF